MRNIRLIILGTFMAILVMGLFTDALFSYYSRMLLKKDLIEVARVALTLRSEPELARALIMEEAEKRAIVIEDIVVDKERMVISGKREIGMRFAWMLGKGKLTLYARVSLEVEDGRIVIR